MANLEPILVEWCEFARTQPAAAGLSRTALRDHAGQILRDIARDLSQPANVMAEPVPPASAADATLNESLARNDVAGPGAETHGADRAMNGFTFREMVAEFRALRAIALRKWIDETYTLTAADVDDMLRFNAAIDRAVGESVSRFSQDLDRAKDLFIAILTHDLRSPLQAVQLTTRLLLETDVDAQKRTTALQRIQRSTWRMSGMIEDLLDFTRTRIGSGLSVDMVDTDLGELAREAVDEARGAFPTRRFELTTDGNLVGQIDAQRMKQVLANLLSNAADYGEASSPVVTEVSGTAGQIRVTVMNSGELIPQDQMAVMFDPFKRLQQDADDLSNRQHLGLGLYIANQLVEAHGGRISVTSTEADGTRFTVVLPRR